MILRVYIAHRIAVWALALCALSPGATSALEPDKLFEQVSPSVWTVRALDAQGKLIASGSAVVVGPGRLVTTCSVLRQGRAIQVRQDNVSHGATLEFPDPERDLCQLAVSNFAAPAVSVAPMNTLRVGQRVYAIGSPRGVELTLGDGLISSLRAGLEGAPLIQTTAALSTGSSGGGLFDTEGRLIGITTVQRRDGQNLNFAIPAEWLAEIPERGQAVLDRRRKATITATAGPPAAPPSEFPRQITGEAFSKFFQTHRTLNGAMTGRPVRLELAGSYVDAYTSMPEGAVQFPSGIPASVRGSKRQDDARNELCFGFVGVVSSFWRGMEGCYHLVQTSTSEYLLRPVKDAVEFRFALK